MLTSDILITGTGPMLPIHLTETRKITRPSCFIRGANAALSEDPVGGQSSGMQQPKPFEHNDLKNRKIPAADPYSSSAKSVQEVAAAGWRLEMRVQTLPKLFQCYGMKNVGNKLAGQERRWMEETTAFSKVSPVFKPLSELGPSPLYRA